MIVLRRLPARPVKFPAPVVAIGIFDGVHRGHQAILRRALKRARAIQATPMAITFFPHPMAVLHPKLLPPLLLSLENRLKAFASCGIRAALVIPFTRNFSRWPAEKFVKRLLVDRLRVREIVVGHDFGFGAGRSGSVETLRELGRRAGFRVHAVGPVTVGGERIASRKIRRLIQKGDLTHAARFLGRPISVEGRVVHGAGRGERLGFPTANLRVEAGVLPAVGVYAVSATVGGRRYRGMANIGFRPTFRRDNDKIPAPILEVHLFGAVSSLYRKRMEVLFLKRLRPERRFPSAAALARQLALDARRAKACVRGSLGA